MKYKAFFLSLLSFLLLTGCGAADNVTPADDTASAVSSSDGDQTEKSPLASFSASSVDGDTYTGDIFSDYDITMVNVWATWCPPCAAELPDLAVVYDQKPENVNMISICTDAGESADAASLAKQMVSDAGGDFLILIPDSVLNDVLLADVMAIPTTFFIDKNGYTVGEPHVGSDNSAAYLSMIDDALSRVS